MKINLFLFFFFVFLLPLYTPIYAQHAPRAIYVEQYTPDVLDANLLIYAAKARQNRYDNNKAYLYNLLHWISELKTKTDDSDFIASMKRHEANLKAILREDLSLYGKFLSDTELEIRNDIDDYNSRITNPNTYYEKAIQEMEKNNFVKAVEYLNHTVSLAEECSNCHLFLGHCFFMLDAYEDADKQYLKYILMKPKEAIGYAKRGELKYYMGQYPEAISHFTKEIDINPNVDAYFMRGSAKLELEDLYGAYDDFKTVVEVDPNHSMAYNNIAHIQWLQKKYSEALKSVNVAIEKDDENYIAYLTKAEIMFDLKRYKDVISNCNSSIALQPNYENPYFLRGRAHYRLGFKENACMDWSVAGQYGHAKAYKFITDYCK